MPALHRLFALLVFIMPSILYAQEGGTLFTENFAPEEFAARRAQVYDAIGSDGIAVVQGEASPRGYVSFRQSNEFYYLTGIEVPHAYLLLDGGSRRATLYLPHRNEGRERGEGKMLAAEDVDFLMSEIGFDSVYGPEMLAEQLGRYTRRGPVPTLYTPFSPPEGFAESRDLAIRLQTDIFADPWDGRLSRHDHFIAQLQSRFPRFEIKDLTPTLDELRLIKSPAELALLRKATRLSGLALMEAMRSTEPGIKEYELDAVAKYIYYRDGAQGDAYYSLIASGRNAYFPHYHEGERTMLDGDFLLMDYAPDFGYYMSDVTRMWPVNGTFSQTQRDLYSFYLACYQSILNHIRPGASAAQIAGEAAAEMKKHLAAVSFSKPTYQQAAEEFVASYERRAAQNETYLGHWVGMATHDVGTYTGPLKPGMVFTIEPALRVPDEMIYIRLEDLIIITEEGAEIVSDFVPMEIDQIEELMKEQGLLQRYPRDIPVSGILGQ